MVFITRARFTKLTKLSCGKHWQKGCNGFYCLNHTAPWQHYSLTQLNHIAGQLGLHIQKQCIEESEKKICKHPHYLTPCWPLMGTQHFTVVTRRGSGENLFNRDTCSGDSQWKTSHWRKLNPQQCKDGKREKKLNKKDTGFRAKLLHRIFNLLSLHKCANPHPALRDNSHCQSEIAQQPHSSCSALSFHWGGGQRDAQLIASHGFFVLY